MIITAFFANAGVPALLLTPTIDIWRVSDQVQVVTAGSMTEVGGGFYFHDFTAFVRSQDYGYVADGGSGLANGDRFVVAANVPDEDTQLLRHQGAIWIDTANGAAGTTVGVNGIPENPVNSLADAITLAASTGLRRYSIRKTSGGPLVLTSAHDDWEFVGIGEGVVISLGGQDVDGTRFTNCELSGVQNGLIRGEDCRLDGVTDMNGIYARCRLSNTLGLLAGGSVHLEFCTPTHDAIGGPAPVISFTGAGTHQLHIHAYSGDIEIRDMTNATDNLEIQLISGKIIIGATNTNGDGVFSGIGVLDEALAGGITIDSLGFFEPEVLLAAFVGARQVTIHVEDGIAVAIPNVSVDIYDSTNVIFLGEQSTDTSGNAVFALDDGSYNARLIKAGVSFTTPEPFTVTGDQTNTFVGTPFTISPPSAPDLCVIFGTIRNAGGANLPGVCVRAFADTTPQDVGGAQLSTLLAEVVTDQNGLFQVELIQASSVRFTIPDTGFDQVKIVPTAASQDITTWP